MPSAIRLTLHVAIRRHRLCQSRCSYSEIQRSWISFGSITQRRYVITAIGDYRFEARNDTACRIDVGATVGEIKDTSLDEPDQLVMGQIRGNSFS